MASQQFNPEQPPELVVSQWFNTEPLSLKALKGKVVVLVAFQMQCAGSLRHALPQATRIARAFTPEEVAVVGLHMVFENHKDMAPEHLAEFLKTEHIDIPVAVDAHSADGLPQTMEAYGMQGTPTVLVFDRQGRLRRHYLGAVDDVRLGAEIMALCIEDRDAPREQAVAIEQKLHAALVDPNEHHHDHDGGCCGGHHDHDHGHSHDHGHEGGCCGGHDHSHDHGHKHEHAHGEGCGCKH
ncbi:TlpA disulfide reductase family protein [Hyphomicrobium sulfonivorans]|uniref:TlpA disulfide reductase family protein n=1 Tax=Hyphomicrobium sulfonivorans TaxID=121290 RepID=UPI00156F5EB8|nr:TlpA disulfide reductase family protein [Hyphomicrobium sulfonivorans]MBI1649520.1 TlpA family protein disulfide reductase [Hyphomicrobium sulfonivorans]NSL71436.1 hypothetical protein [Hyphomicrobium sulfonivorans]